MDTNFFVQFIQRQKAGENVNGYLENIQITGEQVHIREKHKAL